MTRLQNYMMLSCLDIHALVIKIFASMLDSWKRSQRLASQSILRFIEDAGMHQNWNFQYRCYRRSSEESIARLGKTLSTNHWRVCRESSLESRNHFWSWKHRDVYFIMHISSRNIHRIRRPLQKHESRNTQSFPWRPQKTMTVKVPKKLLLIEIS